MKKLFATVLFAGTAAAFALPGAAQLPANAMSLVAAAPAALPLQAAAPDPLTAWLMAAGFLVVIVIRRLAD